MSQGIKFGLASLVLMLAAVVELVAAGGQEGGRGKIVAESLGAEPIGKVPTSNFTDTGTSSSEWNNKVEITTGDLRNLCLEAQHASDHPACARVGLVE